MKPKAAACLFPPNDTGKDDVQEKRMNGDMPERTRHS